MKQNIDLYLYVQINKIIDNMKDSAWVYVKDCMLLSTHFIFEIALIPFHLTNDAYERAKKKMNN